MQLQIDKIDLSSQLAVLNGRLAQCETELNEWRVWWSWGANDIDVQNELMPTTRTSLKREIASAGNLVTAAAAGHSVSGSKPPDTAASKIQACFRGAITRGSLNKCRAAAILIQCRFRGMLARRLARTEPQAVHQESTLPVRCSLAHPESTLPKRRSRADLRTMAEVFTGWYLLFRVGSPYDNAAATSIQSLVRGASARRRVAALEALDDRMGRFCSGAQDGIAQGVVDGSRENTFDGSSESPFDSDGPAPLETDEDRQDGSCAGAPHVQDSLVGDREGTFEQDGPDVCDGSREGTFGYDGPAPREAVDDHQDGFSAQDVMTYLANAATIPDPCDHRGVSAAVASSAAAASAAMVAREPSAAAETSATQMSMAPPSMASTTDATVVMPPRTTHELGCLVVVDVVDLEDSVIALSRSTMDALGLFRGDCVLVEGDGGRETVCYAIPDDRRRGPEASISRGAQYNLRGRPEATVSIRVCEQPPDGTRVRVVPSDVDLRDGSLRHFVDTWLMPYFRRAWRLARPGDHFWVPAGDGARLVEFEYVEVEPGEICIVVPETLVDCVGA